MQKLALKEKIGYALGDTAANIAWRLLTTFLLVFYTDVFGIKAEAAGIMPVLSFAMLGKSADYSEWKNYCFATGLSILPAHSR